PPWPPRPRGFSSDPTTKPATTKRSWRPHDQPHLAWVHPAGQRRCLRGAAARRDHYRHRGPFDRRVPGDPGVPTRPRRRSGVHHGHVVRLVGRGPSLRRRGPRSLGGATRGPRVAPTVRRAVPALRGARAADPLAVSDHRVGVLGWMFLLLWNTFSGAHLAFTSAGRR